MTAYQGAPDAQNDGCRSRDRLLLAGGRLVRLRETRSCAQEIPSAYLQGADIVLVVLRRSSDFRCRPKVAVSFTLEGTLFQEGTLRRVLAPLLWQL